MINLDLQISVEDTRWNKIMSQPIEAFISTYIESTLNHSQIISTIPKHLEISVLLTNDEEIKELNRMYRGKDTPTNTLSFPQEEDISSMRNLDACVLLGDIVLSIETIQIEAVQQQKSISHHLAHLIVHSVLHLLGYDHEKDNDAKEMEALEIDVLQLHNIANPYESDTSMV
jgi:probable rRNA maturation factor